VRALFYALLTSKSHQILPREVMKLLRALAPRCASRLRLASAPCGASDFKLRQFGAKLTILHEENTASPAPGNCPTGLSEPCDTYVLSIPTITRNPTGDRKADIDAAAGISIAFGGTCADIIAGSPAFEISIPRRAFSLNAVTHIASVQAVVPDSGASQAFVKGSIPLRNPGSLSLHGAGDFSALASGPVAFAFVTPPDSDSDDPEVSCVQLTPTYKISSSEISLSLALISNASKVSPAPDVTHRGSGFSDCVLLSRLKTDYY